MARKGWSVLSPQYRKRLEKAGITKSDYESGASIQKARGHSQTPERPTAAKPGVHVAYIKERDRLITRIVHRKHDFENSVKYNPTGLIRGFKENPPSLKILRLWASYTKEEYLDALRTADRDTAEIFGYH